MAIVSGANMNFDRLSHVVDRAEIGAGFGSYGWANLVTKEINARLGKAGITLLNDEVVSQNYTPSEADLDALMELGKQIAEPPFAVFFS